MKYTNKIQSAIEFAINVHQIDRDQKRKGKNIPYITHPLTVGLILSQANASEDVIIAGILHDTIEDSIKEKKITKEIISEYFGNNIAELVNSVSEENKNDSWELRKLEALEHIKHFSNDSVLLKSADIISNVTEILSDYNKIGDNVFNNFKSGKDKTLGNYERVIDALLLRYEDSPLSSDLKNCKEKITSIR